MADAIEELIQDLKKIPTRIETVIDVSKIVKRIEKKLLAELRRRVS